MESIIPTEEDIMELVKAASMPKREVRFMEHVTRSSARSQVAEEDLPKLWYSKPEIAVFKAKLQTAGSTGACIRGDATNPIECANRLRCQQLTTVCLLQAHRRKRCSSDEMSTLSEKCTAWSKEMALVRALATYCEVYEPNMTSLIPKVETDPPNFSISCKKRAVSFDDSDSTTELPASKRTRIISEE